MFVLYIIIGIACIVMAIKTFLNFHKFFKFYSSVDKVKTFRNLSPVRIDNHLDEFLQYYWEVPGFKDDTVVVQGVDIEERKDKNCDAMLFMKNGEYFVRDNVDFEFVHWWEILYGIINLFGLGIFAIISVVIFRILGVKAFAMSTLAFLGMLVFSRGITYKLMGTSIYSEEKTTDEVLYTRNGVKTPKIMIVPMIGGIIMMAAGIIISMMLSVPTMVLNVLLVISVLAAVIIMFASAMNMDSINRIEWLEDDDIFAYKIVESV